MFNKIIPINSRKFDNKIYYTNTYIVTSVICFFGLTTEKVTIFNRIRTFFTLFNKCGNNKGYYRTHNNKTLKNYKKLLLTEIIKFIILTGLKVFTGPAWPERPVIAFLFFYGKNASVVILSGTVCF